MSLFPIYSLAVWTLMAPLIVALFDWVSTMRHLKNRKDLRGVAAHADDYIARVAYRKDK